MSRRFTDLESRQQHKRVKEVLFAFGYRHIEGDKSIPLLTEYLSFLRKSETRRAPWEKRSPQVNFRNKLIDYMMKVANEENMTAEAVYLAIYLLDRFMDKHNIDISSLQYVATVCLVLSGKLIEVSSSKYKYQHFRKYVKHHTACTVDTRQQCLVGIEMVLLKSFQFNILVPTEVNFLEVYLLFVFDGKRAYDEKLNNNYPSMPNANYPDRLVERPVMAVTSADETGKLSAIYDTAFYILEVLTCAGRVEKTHPSLISAAILMATRREHELNFWTPTLQQVTSYSLTITYECLQAFIEPVIKRVKWNQPFNKPDFFAPNSQLRALHSVN